MSACAGGGDLATHLAVKDATTGLFGASGAGKSTLLGLIAGTLQPQSGRIVLDGKTLFDRLKGIIVPREQRPIGVVLQQDSIQGDETVKANLRAVYDRTLKQLIVLANGRMLRNGSFRDMAREENLRGYLGVRQIEEIWNLLAPDNRRD